MKTTTQSLNHLINEVRKCQACKNLPLGPNPVFRAHKNSKILIVGQAPGIKVHQTGIPWNDASGDRLRNWLGVERDLFYNEKIFAILPAGFCYPGKGVHGDLPPSKECFNLWHKKLTDKMPDLELIILLGQYAHQAYLGMERKKNLTETVRSWEDYLPAYIVLPHPSPLNNIWLHKNPWFNQLVVPELKDKIRAIL